MSKTTHWMERRKVPFVSNKTVINIHLQCVCVCLPASDFFSQSVLPSSINSRLLAGCDGGQLHYRQSQGHQLMADSCNGGLSKCQNGLQSATHPPPPPPSPTPTHHHLPFSCLLHHLGLIASSWECCLSDKLFFSWSYYSLKIFRRVVILC